MNTTRDSTCGHRGGGDFAAEAAVTAAAPTPFGSPDLNNSSGTARRKD